jgi:hypothetical protein
MWKKILLHSFTLFVILIGMLTLAQVTLADTQGDHLGYLHALSDLRYARAYLDRFTPNDQINDEEQHAIAEIDETIREIMLASIIDGKDLHDHPPLDMHLRKGDRYHKALELLDQASGDMNQKEDNILLNILKQNALKHVDKAHQIVTQLFIERHPYYLHALSDLRNARAYLDKFTPNEQIDKEEQSAIDAMDAAMHEIIIASLDDHKDIHDHLPIDIHLQKSDRYHKALELLDQVNKDISQEEDDGFAQGLQHRAQVHVDEAHHIVEHIIAAANTRLKHPYYLSALADLRYARAFLDKLTPDDQMNDAEQSAIAEIDAAYGEIMHAAINDGKDLRDHPPIDVNLHRRDRYRQVLELLNKAKQDIRHEGNDPLVKELQHRAVNHLDAAQRIVSKAIERIRK